jgi:hypothetical protein
LHPICCAPSRHSFACQSSYTAAITLRQTSLVLESVKAHDPPVPARVWCSICSASLKFSARM